MAMRAALSLSLAAVALSPLVVEATSVTREVIQGPGPFRSLPQQEKNFTEEILKLRRGPTQQELDEELKARKERARQRSERAREKIKRSQPENVERMTKEQVNNLNQEEHPWMRRAAWGSSSSGAWADFLEDPSQEYDKWAQGYRLLGAYIDCDHNQGEGSGSGDNNNNNDGDGQTACSRWAIWAAYVDENYAGNEYYEYYGDSPVGVLDCHDPDTSWKLLGVYRQEFYQFIEQISKHVWAIDEYEYVTALAGLAYMTDYDCWDTGSTDNSGNTLYAGVEPLEGGQFQMSLYTDDGYCLTPNENAGSFDDLGLGSDMDLGGSGDGDDGYNDDAAYDMSEWWSEAQEASLTNLNDVYQSFRYCYSCVDYPTYQDGYFIGDDGTDDDDLINQCWKFWSHDSYVCETDCLAKAHAQGTILAVNYNGQTFGSTPGSFYENYASSGSGSGGGRGETKMTRLMANVFVAFSFIVFVATFLAFAVARRSRQREKRSSKRRRLLDDGKSRSSRGSRRRRSDADGLFRSSRSKSADQRARSSGGKRSKSSSGKSRTKSKSRRPSSGEEGTYDPPRESQKRSSSRSGSRRALDDF